MLIRAPSSSNRFRGTGTKPQVAPANFASGGHAAPIVAEPASVAVAAVVRRGESAWSAIQRRAMVALIVCATDDCCGRHITPRQAMRKPRSGVSELDTRAREPRRNWEPLTVHVDVIDLMLGSPSGCKRAAIFELVALALS